MKDPVYDEEVPDIMVRCLLCQQEMTKSEFEGVHESECDIEKWDYA